MGCVAAYGRLQTPRWPEYDCPPLHHLRQPRVVGQRQSHIYRFLVFRPMIGL